MEPGLEDKLFDRCIHSNSSQALNTRRGAAFGFAGIARLAGSQLTPHVAALIPKLYRYQYDPNQRVQVCKERGNDISNIGNYE